MSKEQEFIGSSQMNVKNTSPREELNDLPKDYGDTKIVVMVKDPLWIHAYWEINKGKIEHIKNMLGEEYNSSQYTLRVHDVSGVDFKGDNSLSYFDINVGELARNWYINVGNPDREYIVDLGLITNSGQFILIARSNRVKTPRNTVSENVDEKWMMVEEKYSKIVEMSGGGKVGRASADIMAEITRRLFSEQNLSSHTLSSMGSSTVQAKKEKVEEDFWFKADAELIIYGETLPDATVELNGTKIKLREDGSFSLRFDLPDGEHPFSITARSANGKHKRAKQIDVNRKSH